jgi:CheY-like chemotaxis protein
MPNTPSPPGPLILLVEDNAEVRETMRLLLEDAHYSVALSDGVTAKGDAVRLQPDVILLDLYMPVTGETVYHQLDADPATHTIPVMLTSAVPDLGAIAARLGVGSYLRKPFTLKLLVKEIQSLVNARRAYLAEQSQGEKH